MKLTKSKKIQALLDQLRASSRMVAGQAAVRRPVALQVLGFGLTRATDMERYHRMPRLILHLPRGINAPYGYHVYWPLTPLEAYVRQRWRRSDHCHWTPEDLQALYRMVGRCTMEQMAKRLGRTVISVRDTLQRQGWSEAKVMLERDKLLSNHRLAQLMQVHPRQIRRWRHLGMPSATQGAARGAHYYDLKQVRDWLATRPQSLVHLKPIIRRDMGLRDVDLEVAA